MKTPLTLSAAVLVAALTLTGCSTDAESGGPAGGHHGSGPTSGASSASSGDHNDADTAFARMMIPHHAQAVEMSDIVLAKEGVPDAVRDLAAKIKAAQAPEIELMTGWLGNWGESPESTGHAHHGMDGMMSDADMDTLKAASGADAARLFLTQMIAHHEGAIAMARTEAADGRNPDAITLSEKIISEQESEIREMKELLGSGASADESGLPSPHVHGLHVNAETGAVLLATHDGLFDVTASPATRIGDIIDLMGFSGAGQGVFYASGHPGPGSDLPDPVGLLRSADGGKTWERLSRQGESDFHALTVSTSGIVGFDGTLLTSSDGRTWSKANANFAPAVLAGNPASDVVVGTTPDGLYGSIDGGKNWELNKAAPIIQFAAFANSTVAYGIEPDGTVHSSTDAGSSWSRTGTVEGKVQAITAVEAAGGKPQLWVATAAGVVVSSDGGSTFTAGPGS